MRLPVGALAAAALMIAAAPAGAQPAAARPPAASAVGSPAETLDPQLIVGTTAQPGDELRVCFLEDDAPRAHRGTGRGLDLDVMRAVAASASATLEPVWSPSRSGFSEVESTDLPLGRLARGECDAVASVPGEQGLGRLRQRIDLTRPYYGAAFELIAAEGTAAELSALARLPVGVQLQSFAHLAAQSLGIDWRARPTPREILAMLDAGEVEAALVWGPALAPLGRAPIEGWSPPRALRWNEHVAVRRGSPWRARIDEALARLVASGDVERWAREHGVPPRAPFETTSDASALAELRSALDAGEN